MLKPKLITFDLDGTVIDDEWAHEQAKSLIAKELGSADDLNLSYYTGRSNRLFWKSVCDKLNIEGNLEKLTERQFREVLRLVKESGQPESVGLTETLKYLKEKGYTVAITTGSDEFFVDGIMEHLGITDYFDVKITKDHVTCVKPDPDIYLAAQRFAGVESERSWGIEDSTSGCEALKRAGMICVGYANGGKNPQDLSKADYIVDEISGLIDILEKNFK